MLLKGPRPADIHWSTEMGYSALHTAAELRRTKAVQMLIDHRADVNHTAVNGSTPLASPQAICLIYASFRRLI